MAKEGTEEITEETWVGDTVETEVTNEMASENGYPARTQAGDLILIVQKEGQGSAGREKLIDADGGEWEDLGNDLVEWDDDAPTFNKTVAAPKSKAAPKEAVAA